MGDVQWRENQHPRTPHAALLRARRDRRRACRGWTRGDRDPRIRSVERRKNREAGVRVPAYFPSTAFLKSSPMAGFGPIHVATIASAVALPGIVPFTFPFTSTIVP